MWLIFCSGVSFRDTLAQIYLTTPVSSTTSHLYIIAYTHLIYTLISYVLLSTIYSPCFLFSSFLNIILFIFPTHPYSLPPPHKQVDYMHNTFILSKLRIATSSLFSSSMYSFCTAFACTYIFFSTKYVCFMIFLYPSSLLFHYSSSFPLLILYFFLSILLLTLHFDSSSSCLLPIGRSSTPLPYLFVSNLHACYSYCSSPNNFLTFHYTTLILYPLLSALRLFYPLLR